MRYLVLRTWLKSRCVNRSRTRTFFLFSLKQLTWRKLACFVSVTNHRFRLRGRATKNAPAAAMKLRSLRPVLMSANDFPISRVHQERAYRSSGLPMNVPRRTRLIILSHFGCITTWPLERAWCGSSSGWNWNDLRALHSRYDISGATKGTPKFIKHSHFPRETRLPFPVYRRQINSVKPRLSSFYAAPFRKGDVSYV